MRRLISLYVFAVRPFCGQGENISREKIEACTFVTFFPLTWAVPMSLSHDLHVGKRKKREKKRISRSEIFSLLLRFWGVVPGRTNWPSWIEAVLERATERKFFFLWSCATFDRFQGHRHTHTGSREIRAVEITGIGREENLVAQYIGVGRRLILWGIN